MKSSLCVGPLLVVLMLADVSSAPAQEEVPAGDDRAVYRVDPRPEGNRMVVVPPEEIKPGLAYSYYNEQLNRRVWGFATEEGDFQYVFGPGTILPTDRLDLQLSPERQAELLEQRLPRLERELETTGRSPAVKLEEDGTWRLLARSSSIRLYDLLTLHRWEWHGLRRVAVLHTHGDMWQYVDGRYYPATGPVFVPCWPQQRFGSAGMVVRTVELEE